MQAPRPPRVSDHTPKSSCNSSQHAPGAACFRSRPPNHRRNPNLLWFERRCTSSSWRTLSAMSLAERLPGALSYLHEADTSATWQKMPDRTRNTIQGAASFFAVSLELSEHRTASSNSRAGFPMLGGCGKGWIQAAGQLLATFSVGLGVLNLCLSPVCHG